jgi:quinol monooxygenase YgiN
MIRVIIERQVKTGKDLSPLLRELRATVMHQPGYVTGETIINMEDRSIIMVVSTWQSLKHWKAWETSEIREGLYQKIEPLLVEKPKVKVYEIMATENRRE